MLKVGFVGFFLRGRVNCLTYSLFNVNSRRYLFLEVSISALKEKVRLFICIKEF